jgi:HD-GYP domain-containing protein (c-di-GMP phosphodiesterase class II)
MMAARYDLRMTVEEFSNAVRLQPLALPEREAESVGERVRNLHQEVMRAVPQVDRIACALYDPQADTLRTFVDSTQHGAGLQAYECPLGDSPSLLRLKELRQTRVIQDIPASVQGQSHHSRWLREQGFLSSYTVPLFHQGEFEGVLFFDSASPDAFTPEVAQRLEVYARMVGLMVSHEIAAVRALVGSMRIAQDFARLRDVETGGHLERMSRVARIIASAIAPARGLSDEFVEQVFLFAPLHDIGKIGVPDSLLAKPGRFTDQERLAMQAHVPLGVQMVERLVAGFGLAQLAGVRVLHNIVACHHERMDGHGYPAGLAGDAIPLEARIVAVADVLDALVNRRTYKEPWPLQEALDELDRMAAEGHLDPACVAPVRPHEAQLRAILIRYAE